MRAQRWDFVDAFRVFEDRWIEREDTRRDDGEVRINVIGRIGDDVVQLTYTERDGTKRIISLRKASRKERKQWHLFGTP